MANTNRARKKPKTPDKLATAAEPSVPKTSAIHKWTFLTNHSHVLILLHTNPELVLRQVAIQVGITERAVQRIVQDLEADSYIERERVGRRNHYRVNLDAPLRHPIESHRKIGDLLTLIAAEQ